MKKRLIVSPAVLAVLLAVTTTLSAQETRPADRDVLECEGSGLIHVVRDECMHDGGGSAVGDSLEVYCYLGIARFCLSGEGCPWREAPASRVDETGNGGEARKAAETSKRDATCSRAGLETEWMATAWCEAWSDFDHYTCTELG